MSGRKARGDAKLKTLPLERQGAIVEHMLGHTLAETVAWLREDGVATSSGALSEFYSWYQLRGQLARNESTVEALVGELAKQDRSLTAERVQDIGQAFFAAMAMERQDAKAWYLTQKIGLQKEQLSLERKKFQRDTAKLFLEWWEDRRVKEIASGAGTNAEKIERLGELMFGEDWR